MNVTKQDCTNDMLRAYYELLSASGALWSLRGLDPVEVYDNVPNTAGLEYVTLASTTAVSDDTKQDRGNEITVTVVVYEFYSKGEGGKHDACHIADQIVAVICTGGPLQPVGSGFNWNVLSSVLEMHDGFESPTETGFLYQRVLRFRHIVEQL